MHTAAGAAAPENAEKFFRIFRLMSRQERLESLFRRDMGPACCRTCRRARECPYGEKNLQKICIIRKELYINILSP